MQNNDKQIIGLKKQKLQKLKDLGIDPYPIASKRTASIRQLLDDEQRFITSQKQVVLCGRLRALRRQGKIGFADLEDSGGRLQLYVSKQETGDENYEVFKLFDLGDIVQVSGVAFVTKTGQFSLKVKEVVMLSKGIRPLPTVKQKQVDGKLVRFDEFSDTELRYRKRYLDLILNPSVKQTFVYRAKIVAKIRQILDERGFLEVDTPVMQPLYGGANAKPFTTFYNSLGKDFFLRIATELYLKRLIVGGYEKVYEIGKNFRNEGVDRTHNPEFTAIELYQAYSDLDGMMQITQELLVRAAKEVMGKSEFLFNGHKIRVEAPFKKASMVDLVREQTGEDFSDLDYDKLAAFCQSKGIEVKASMGAGALLAEVFDAFVEEKLVQPTFVVDYPKEISPLAKQKSSQSLLTDRFELFIGGKEFANAFSELNDPLEQSARMEDQAKKREMGDDEANTVDYDFLEALEYAMPPTGGLGIGVDRMIMLLTENDSIRDVMLFPQMRQVK